MQINSMDNEVNGLKGIIKFGVFSQSGLSKVRNYFGDVIALVIKRMKEWGYLTECDTSTKIYEVNYYNRTEFLINVLPNLKRVFNKLIN